MKKATLLVLLFSMLFTLNGIAQDDQNSKSEKLTKQDKNLLSTANDYFKEGNYTLALAIYKVLAESYPHNADLVYKTGICYLYKADEKENAIEYISNAGKLNPKLEDLNFNMGRAYHTLYKFQDAIRYFESYLNENPPIVKKNLAEHYIEFCKNGEIISPNIKNMIIENIGKPINTENSEYVPGISADESILIYTYKGERSTGGMMDGKFNPTNDGEFYEDIFVSYKIGEKWTDPQSIGENINTTGHDASIALSTDGQKLFIFKSTSKDKGDIYMSLLEGETWSTPANLGPNINTKAWEGSVSMSAGGLTLFFASERPGGLGGRDIYKSTKQVNGEWGPAINLGPTVNTKRDEDAPFIHPDGTTLIFSSKGHNSLGGYDIFYSSNATGEWSQPANMGVPVNTTDDDLYYVLTPDGQTGYYSSNRKEGYGQQDIYVITPGLIGNKPILALAVGQIILDSKPVEAKITVLDTDNGMIKGNYGSNSSTGKYLVALPPGYNYKLVIEVAGNQPHYEYISVKSLETYVRLQQDIQIYSEEYMASNKIDSVSSYQLQKNLDLQLKKYNEESNPAVYETRIYNELLKKRGDIQKDSVTYNVDLGTYETAADFNIAKVSDMSTIETNNVNGSTNYYVKGFPTLHTADDFRQKLILRDYSLAEVTQVTVNDKGKIKLVPDFYSTYYSRKDYTVPTETKLIKTKYNPELAERIETEKIVSEYGDKQMNGLSYKLELATVDKSSDFDMKKMSTYGKVENKKLSDGKIHYTIGNFKTLREVNDFKTQLIQKDPEVEKSLITVLYQNDRKTLKEFFNDPAMIEKLNNSSMPVVAKIKPTISESTKSVSTEATKGTVAKAALDEPTPCETDKPYSFTAFIGKTLNDPIVYSELLTTAGAMCLEGLTFKVQVGAYRHPENYKYNNLKPLGIPIENSNAYADTITRFTMGEFKTLKDTEKLRQKAINAGTKDAWITAIYNGKRYTLENLIPLNFFNKAVN